MAIRSARNWLADRDVKKKQKRKKNLYGLCICVCVWVCLFYDQCVCVPTCVHKWALSRLCSLSPSPCLSSYLEMLASLRLWHLQEGGWVCCHIVCPRRHGRSCRALPCLWEQLRLRTRVFSGSSGTGARRSCWLFTGSVSWEPFPDLLVRDKMGQFSKLTAVPSRLGPLSSRIVRARSQRKLVFPLCECSLDPPSQPNPE